MKGRALVLSLLVFAFISSGAFATVDVVMVTFRTSHVFQQVKEYLQVAEQIKKDIERLKSFGDINQLAKFLQVHLSVDGKSLGVSIDADVARPAVLQDLQPFVQKGGRDRLRLRQQVDTLLTVDLTNADAVQYQKVKDTANAISHVTTSDAYGKALEIKAKSNNEGIEVLVDQAEKAENFQEKATAFTLFYEPIALKLNTINQLDAMLNTLESSRKMPTLVGEAINDGNNSSDAKTGGK